jgi:hypothetical protein
MTVRLYSSDCAKLDQNSVVPRLRSRGRRYSGTSQSGIQVALPIGTISRKITLAGRLLLRNPIVCSRCFVFKRQVLAGPSSLGSTTLLRILPSQSNYVANNHSHTISRVRIWNESSYDIEQSTKEFAFVFEIGWYEN